VAASETIFPVRPAGAVRTVGAAPFGLPGRLADPSAGGVTTGLTASVRARAARAARAARSAHSARSAVPPATDRAHDA
jgi:hypothetical protein